MARSAIAKTAPGSRRPHRHILEALMLLKLLLAVALLLIAILAFAATKPPTLNIQRSILINAPPEKIFPLIDDFPNWRAWSEQDNADPTILRSYSGPASGKDTVYEWSSSGSAGQGRMIITESTPYQHIVVVADFVKPFVTHNENDFVLQPAGSSTQVTWNWRATNIYLLKVLSLFCNPDRMIGPDFEKSLANLKTLAERN